MKTTSNVKAMILAIAMTATSSAVFALDGTLNIIATVSGVAQAKVTSELSDIVINPAGTGSITSGTTAADVCFYSSTGAATATFAGNSYLIGAVHRNQIPYKLQLKKGASSEGIPFAPSLTSAVTRVLTGLDTSSDCSATTIATGNSYTLNFELPAFADGATPKMDTYWTSVAVTIATA